MGVHQLIGVREIARRYRIWLPKPQRAYGLHRSTNPPNSTQLWSHFRNCAVPMLGFGFMDNLVMIQAGDFIDTTLGVTFGLSTITAAAFGQVFSDVSGVCFGGTIEALAGRLGLACAYLTAAQTKLQKVRLVGTLGRIVGVIIGCLLGMSSLLLIDADNPERKKRQCELAAIIASVVKSAKKTMNVDSCEVLFYDAEKNVLTCPWKICVQSPRSRFKLWSWANMEDSPTVVTSENVAMKVVKDRKPMNVSCDDEDPSNKKRILCYPIFDDNAKKHNKSRGSVIGVVQFKNKRNSNGCIVPFDRNDEKIAGLLSENVALYVGLVLSPHGDHTNHVDLTDMPSPSEIKL
eukprot:GHVL01010785.1.p1 GENE.GHVL01010785.1~~GHVL01010785.1.p1  ORF type:complete len:347 (+),score=46.94 GHVL01010785.1:86-1126(+)